MALTRQQILDMKLPTVEVQVPSWGGTVLLRTLTGRERDAWDGGMLDRKEKTWTERLDNISARLVAMCAVDAEGKQLFTEAEADLLGGRDGMVLDLLYKEAQKLNGLGQYSAAEIAKTSSATQSGASGTN